MRPIKTISLILAALLPLIIMCGIALAQTSDMEAIQRAADQGDAEAQFNLGVMYATGDGVPQDYQEAVKWYRRAADQGYADAQYNLGVMYYNGEGVIQDKREAYIWFSIAAITGDEDAVKGRDDTASLLYSYERRAAKTEAKRRLQAIDEGRAGQTDDR